MRILISVVAILSLASCMTAGTAEDFKWAVECPKTVDKGAEFQFMVRTTGASGAQVPDARYHYQILWPEGSGHPTHATGWSGTPETVRVRLVSGKATMVITCYNKAGIEVKIDEVTFEVK